MRRLNLGLLLAATITTAVGACDSTPSDLPAGLFDGDSGADGTSSSPDGSQPSGGAWLHTSGNAILHADGKRFHGKGANIPDPRGCGACFDNPDVAEENRRIDELASWGANFIRLGLESRGSARDAAHDAEYLGMIKEVVTHASSKGIYVLLSVWGDESLTENELPTAETIAIWKVFAKTFAQEPRVLYGLTNEPHGVSDETVWKAMNDAVAAIREEETASGGPQHIVVAQGTQQFARSLAYYITHPITAGGGTNIAYETHIYDAPADYERLLVTPSKSIPVILGEFGPVNVGGSSVSLPGSTPMTVADSILLMDIARKHEVPHVGFTFHMRCPPNLLVDNSNGSCGINMKLTPTPDWGVAFKEKLAVPW